MEPAGKGIESLIREVGKAFEAMRPGRPVLLSGVKGAARSLIALGLCALSPAPVVMVVPDVKTCNRVIADLERFRKIVGPFLGLPDEVEIFPFPSWELTPYTDEWLLPGTAALRMKVLYHLMQSRRMVAVATPEALMHRLVERVELEACIDVLEPGRKIPWEAWLQRLIRDGYTRSPVTEEPGDFSVRGGVIDLFSPLHAHPVRIELDGEEVASLRLFDRVSQRSLKPVERYVISPAQETFPQNLPDKVRAALYALDVSRKGRNEIRRLMRSLTEGLTVENRLWLAPYLCDLTGDLFSFAPGDTRFLMWNAEACFASAERAWQDAAARYKKEREDFSILPPPDALLINPEAMKAKISQTPHVVFGLIVAEAEAAQSFPALNSESVMDEVMGRAGGSAAPAAVVRETVRLNKEGYEVWIAEVSGKKRQLLQEALMLQGVALPDVSGLSREGRGGIVPFHLPENFIFPALKTAFLTALRPQSVDRRHRPEAGKALQPSEAMALRDGEPLVHFDYGIGLYRGLKRMDVLDVRDEFLEMEYARGDKLFVPVDKLNLIQRYVGGGDTPPPLDILGSVSWARKKEKFREDVAKMAQELLELYATRKAIKGHAYEMSTEGLDAFEADFPFRETPDQAKAITDIYRDMAAETPMDRLVCGDVGFGKTEVAMRAAFKAVMGGKQVAVLVPTTVLAEQHFVNFTERFSPYPVRVELLSRFRDKRAQREIISEIASGRVDIAIGTHRLLQKDVKFRDLGLLVVDEEHRFGVAHKELLKRLAAAVDVLILSATPIPRTLQMSMSGLRDLSLITTPPRARRPVVTKIVRFRESVIREGIERELARGGQVFFVHNRVKSIARMREIIQELIPSATVTYAHGQMDEGELEPVILAFMRHETDVLVCTTIIESGVDIPNVNTLFVHHAEQFGLSTLYQLRGRIGRSDRQAYAYFMIPHRAILPKAGLKRLQSLQEYSSLGSGFKLALMDLNMRGGGNLLGHRQSGKISEIGFDLYMKIIEEEVKKLRGEWKAPPPPTDIELPFPAYIPEAYIPQMDLRLAFYRQLADADRPEDVSRLEEELKDRFGALPEEVKNLLEGVNLKLWLYDAGVTRLSGSQDVFTLTFSGENRVDTQKMVALIESDPARFSLSSAQKLIIRTQMPDTREAYCARVKSILKQFLVYDKNQGQKGITEN